MLTPQKLYFAELVYYFIPIKMNTLSSVMRHTLTSTPCNLRLDIDIVRILPYVNFSLIHHV